MDDVPTLHTKWQCKYHVVFIPKCHRKTLYTELRRYLGEVFRRLAVQKESQIEEGQQHRAGWLPILSLTRQVEMEGDM
jgi:putative transposase